MGYTRDRDEFVHLMTKEGADLMTIQRIMRYATTVQAYAVWLCNRNTTDYEDQKCGMARDGIERLCAQYNMTPKFSQDPRGACVKIKVPSGKTNDWGQKGICVPTRGC